MPLARYQPFYLDNLDALRAEIDRLAVDIPVSPEHAVLGEPLPDFRIPLPNRFCSLPVAGLDAEADGSPGPLTFHRYQRLAEGGFAIIWIEAATSGPAAPPNRLRLAEDTLDAFTEFTETLRSATLSRGARHPALILQLITPWEAPTLPSDSEISRHLDSIVQAATLAARAGFDGVDIAATANTLPHALLSARERGGRFGGSFENRIRFLTEAVSRIRVGHAELAIASRLLAFSASRGGFGVNRDDHRRPDTAEPSWLARILRDAGLDLLGLACASPRLLGPPESRPLDPISDSGIPDEHPLQTLARRLDIARTLRTAVPGLPVVGAGFSWLRQFLPDVAATAVADGTMDIVGLSRAALACPDAPARILGRDGLTPDSACIVCFACSEMSQNGGPVGCPIHDPETYGPEFRRQHRFSSSRLAAAARRCHLCEHAPCTAASRTGTDIPGFIEAFRTGDTRRAFEIIQRTDPLPETTARLTPGWLHSEGACIETTLTGKSLPILDLQLSIAWRARHRNETGIRIPDGKSGKRIAIVGAGPAGLAAAIRLLELGHNVEIFERSDTLGGTPELLIPVSRFPGTRPEIDAILAPALDAKRLRIHHGRELGADLTLDTLRRDADAVLLATGLWQSSPLSAAPRPDGVLDALSFLASAKQNNPATVPPRVAILAGGDTAMDAARAAEQLGAEEIFIVFGGPRSEMHWHMAEDWFAEPGRHAMIHCRPLGYQTAPANRLRALRIRHTALGADATLAVDLVIEAMGLEPAATLRAALPGIEFNEHGLVAPPPPADSSLTSLTSLPGIHAIGALVNGGASVARCIAEGTAAAKQIHTSLK